MYLMPLLDFWCKSGFSFWKLIPNIKKLSKSKGQLSSKNLEGFLDTRWQTNPPDSRWKGTWNVVSRRNVKRIKNTNCPLTTEVVLRDHHWRTRSSLTRVDIHVNILDIQEVNDGKREAVTSSFVFCLSFYWEQQGQRVSFPKPIFRMGNRLRGLSVFTLAWVF